MESNWLVLASARIVQSTIFIGRLTSGNMCIVKLCVFRTWRNTFAVQRFMYYTFFPLLQLPPYKVNGKLAVHINSCGQSVDTKSPKRKSSNPCEECGKHIHDPHRFCSIACKVCVNSKIKDHSVGTVVSLSQDSGNLSFKDNKRSPETNASELESTISIAESMEETKTSTSSLQPRKRRVKSIPHRAPFF
ncbi:uncharacterized protein LOC101214401 isoform X2 [Cucumis sativus]|uniref:uncharacterized protein LOC101214401 isoform X2 n=2 Tax=Cucumis sativus TaxID=3659 RepID=UPI0012F51850|nr:uncharacterized protein LOC101214401 isoform X2 [Cucumis sativus]